MLKQRFDYVLPEALIAQYPAAKRDSSKLMVLDRQREAISHEKFSDILAIFDHRHVLILNDTKVIRARLSGRRESSGRTEIFLLRQLSNTRQWEVLLRPAARVKQGERLTIGPDFYCVVLEKHVTEQSHKVEFCFSGSFWDCLDDYGSVPLPPYIRSPAAAEAYQTVFAARPGAVAAPTAGLHFTTALLDELRAKGVQIETVTLHIGYGTFKPVTVDRLDAHQMHEEHYMILPQVAKRLGEARKTKSLVAIGTTVARALESAWTGDCFASGQRSTRLFIYPGGRSFAVVDQLLTNFHLPRSTLLMLVSAFAGKSMIDRAYQDAIRNEYRFYSFGDAMLIR